MARKDKLPPVVRRVLKGKGREEGGSEVSQRRHVDERDQSLTRSDATQIRGNAVPPTVQLASQTGSRKTEIVGSPPRRRGSKRLTGSLQQRKPSKLPPISDPNLCLIVYGRRIDAVELGKLRSSGEGIVRRFLRGELEQRWPTSTPSQRDVCSLFQNEIQLTMSPPSSKL